MLEFTRRQWLQMLAEAWDNAPLEACGLLIGESGGAVVRRFVPIANEAASDRIYRLDGAQYAQAALAADDDGLDIIGVMHSHPRTVAYPSPTDVADAANPMIPSTWHWVIVSLAAGFPTVRSFRIVNGEVEEEPVHMTGST